MTTRTPVSVTKEIAATPERVWALVTDLPRMGEWSPENRGGEWIKGATHAAVGARFKGKNQNGKKNWSAEVTINEMDAPRKFSFALTVFGSQWCDWVYEIEPTATGSRVTHSWIDRRGWFSTWLGGKLSDVADRSVHNLKNMTATLDAIAVAATSSK
jgi:uncharacterized protein YndB with AHSA1/START domain